MSDSLTNDQLTPNADGGGELGTTDKQWGKVCCVQLLVNGEPVGTGDNGSLSPADISTLARLNALLSDATLVDGATLGTASTHDVGTAEGQVVELTTGGALPAVSGENLTGIGGGANDGDATDITGLLIGDGSALGAATSAEVRDALDAENWDAVIASVKSKFDLPSDTVDIIKFNGVRFLYLGDAQSTFAITKAVNILGSLTLSDSNGSDKLRINRRQEGGATWATFAVQNEFGPLSEVAAFGSNGNVLIGTVIDNGDRLQVSGDADVTGQVTATHFETPNVIPETTWAMGTNWTDNGDGTYTSTNASGFNGITSPTLTLVDAGLYRLTFRCTALTSGNLKPYLGFSGNTEAEGVTLKVTNSFTAGNVMSYLMVRQASQPSSIHIRCNNGFEGTIGELTLNRIA